MKVLKIVGAVIAILVALPLLAALFISKDFAVEREVTINVPKQEVFEYVKHLKNQDNFSKWASMDPAMKKEFKGTDGTVGFVSGWTSDMPEVGKGEQEITGIVEGERIDYELRFIEPFESTSLAYMTTTTVSETQTTVTWGFTGKMDYPMNLMLLFMDMDDMVGNDFETGLGNLKKILESDAAPTASAEIPD